LSRRLVSGMVSLMPTLNLSRDRRARLQ
jgi:hypothetical protein